MDIKNFMFGIILIVIPFVLLILCYRNNVYNYCQNDMKCVKKNLIFSLNNLNDKLNNKLKENINKNYQINEEIKIKSSSNDIYIDNVSNNEDQIEGFFGGLTSFFSGSSASNLPVSPGSLQGENLNLLEKKINDRMSTSKNFPPTDDDENSFKEADNAELLNITGSKPYIKNSDKQPVVPNSDNKEPLAIFDKDNFGKKPEIKFKPSDLSGKKTDSSAATTAAAAGSAPTATSKPPDLKSLLGSCQFFNDKCPDNYHPLGNFSVQGIGSSSILSCGNVQNTKPAKAIAQIKNNYVYEIHITDEGYGYNSSSPPKINIEGGKGHGATAEAVVDDDGFLKIIKVINPGYNYSETPNVLIDAPFMNSSCHLCCNNES
jgi:hypothetical protein